VNTKEGAAVDDDSYLGYSVVVGDFGDGGSGAAAGMPRGADLLGKVLFLSCLPNGLNLYICLCMHWHVPKNILNNT
jgi:hypothetical protein